MKFILFTLLLSLSTSSFAWICYDNSGSSIEVVDDPRQIYGAHLNVLMILKGPVINYRFPDRELLEKKFSSDGKVSIFHQNHGTGGFEIISRSIYKYEAKFCGMDNVCVSVTNDYPNNNGVEFIRENQGNWFFRTCN